MVFFSLASGKRSNYLLPLYPPLAVLLGVWWDECITGTSGATVLAKGSAWGGILTLSLGFMLVVAVLLTQSAGADFDHVATLFLHPSDRANLPLLAHSLQRHLPMTLAWLTLCACTLGCYGWGMQRSQWRLLFAALVVTTSSSLSFMNLMFRPLFAEERTYKPFMVSVRSTVKNAPLYFYHGLSDYGVLFYADRHLPSYNGDLATFLENRDLTTPYYILLWEEDWWAHSSQPHLTRLLTSEGSGPEGKHHLVLAAWLPEAEEREGDRASRDPWKRDSGRANAMTYAQIRPHVQGYLQSQHYNEGSFVKVCTRSIRALNRNS